ncbi:MAG: hypothetical protein A3G34_05595 [Candidatus Lindowbacteria bacterium RIFCSPLOWO2_12_FULL_62_27]|nr:MAG: hypothetical protein A3G34_05595 [Candidatus Lindowbacteria bacterium RIFCSPLOWO2_12_FULL_62_27]
MPRIVLDSNEYIYAFGAERKPACERLIGRLIEKAEKNSLSVSRSIADETRRNLKRTAFKLCHRFWLDMACRIDDDDNVPKALFASYLVRGLKPADAQIGAYAEWVNADFLISENRDFLALSKPLPYRIMKASEF